MQRLAWHRAIGLEAWRRNAEFEKQGSMLSVVHSAPSMVAVSVMEPDTICATGRKLHVSISTHGSSSSCASISTSSQSGIQIAAYPGVRVSTKLQLSIQQGLVHMMRILDLQLTPA